MKTKVLMIFFALVFASFWAEGISVSQAGEKEVNNLLKKATYVGTETCATCHEKEYKEFKLSTHARISNDKNAVEGVAQGCEMCHGPGSVHAEASGGKNNIINPQKDPSICFTCHTDKKMEFRLPYHHPVLEGKMTCTDCHDPHGIDVRPWTVTSQNDVNEVCFKCHTDKRGPFVFEHDALKEGCTTCHKVHGSVNDKMLVARDVNLCLRCHATINFPFMGSPNGDQHSDHLPQGTCFSTGCHQAIHGSNFNSHLRY